MLLLPAGEPQPGGDAATAERAWSNLLGGVPVVLVRSVDQARRLLLRAAALPPGTRVALPMNVEDSLLAAVKDHGSRPVLIGFDDALWFDRRAATDARTDIVWAQPAGGTGGLPGAIARGTWVDHAAEAPVLAEPRRRTPAPADAEVWGLHLSSDPVWSGAVLAFPADGGEERAAAVRRLMIGEDRCDATIALAQAGRLSRLAGQQRAVLLAIARGLAEAAGLPMPSAMDRAAAPAGILIVTPTECDPATLYAYIAREHTPVRWLPLLRPLHHAAPRIGHGDHSAAAALLSRCLLIPAGPTYSTEEITHAVLGVVKAAEYLGIRWRTDPGRAASYATFLEELYGPDHDAFRPVFATPNQSRATAPPGCRTR